MDLKELKKLINEEVKKVKEATEPGTPRAKMDAFRKAKEVDPNAPTVKTPTPKDPSVSPPLSKQPSPRSSYQKPEDVFYGLRRMKIALLTKFEIEMKDEETSQIIRDIFDEEVNKLTAKHPDLDVE